MTCTITFIGADNNAPTWASPYLEFREQLFGRRKNDLVDLLDMECTAFVTVFLFSLRSRTACLSPSHGMLAVNYVQVLDVLALVDMSDSRPIDNVALTYVCNCAKLSYKEVRSAVISARAWFAGQERLDQKAVRTGIQDEFVCVVLQRCVRPCPDQSRAVRVCHVCLRSCHHVWSC